MTRSATTGELTHSMLDGEHGNQTKEIEKLLEKNKNADPALKRSFKGHKEAVNSVAFNPNLKQIASGSNDGTVMVWNFKALQRPFRFVGHKGPVYSVACTPNGQTIVSGSADNTVRVWNNTVEGYS